MEESAETAEARRKIVNRLKRAHGQLAGVITKVESGSSCRDVIIQLAAVSAALDKAGFAIISGALQDCLTAEDGSSDLTREEVEKLFLTLS